MLIAQPCLDISANDDCMRHRSLKMKEPTGPIWHQMYTTLSSGASHVEGTPRRESINVGLIMLPPSEILNDVGIDVLGPLTKAKQENLFSIVVTFWNQKLASVMAILKMWAPYVAKLRSECYTMPCAIPNKIVTDNGSLFLSNFLPELYSSLKTKQAETTEYLPKINSQKYFKESTCKTLPLCERPTHRAPSPRYTKFFGNNTSKPERIL